MSEAEKPRAKKVMRCPKGHWFDDEELVYCPECGLPLKSVDLTEIQKTRINNQENANTNQSSNNQNNVNNSDNNQGKVSIDTAKEEKRSGNLSAFIVFLSILVIGFVILEWTETTKIIPAWHQRSGQNQVSDTNNNFVTQIPTQAPTQEPTVVITEAPTEVMPTAPTEALVYVYQYDMNAGIELSSRYESVTVGDSMVYAGDTPEGYRLVDESWKRVFMYDNGSLSEDSVGFAYERIGTTITIPIYDFDNNSFLENWEIELPEGQYSILDILPMRLTINGREYACVSCGPSYFSVDSNGKVKETDEYGRYVNNVYAQFVASYTQHLDGF